ncbi:MAG: hypothetical protein E2581_08710 [Pseudomonas sp.]|uniref:hypothetical protein n=1 Tax=Pseudomonas sp. TaxID=306 RepID=UPI001E05A821|nr:hypothetical protein [Pseudomonas sp.]MPS98567.1 hypothetical protein [Pseudomonas sp.]
MKSEHKCCGRIGPFYSKRVCGKTANFAHEGKHYCGTHHPPSVKDRKAKRDEEWSRQYEERRAREQAAERLRLDKEFRAASYPELLAHLQNVLNAWDSVCSGKGWEPDHLVQMRDARAALRRMTGGT